MRGHIAATLILLVILSAISNVGSGLKGIVVAASIEPLAAIASEICGARGDVLVLVPEGVEPHAFQLTPDVIKIAESADLIVHTGHMSWEFKLVNVTGKPSVGLDEYLAYGLNLSYIPGTGDLNLHGYWLKVENSIAIARAIAHKLAEIDPGNAEFYMDNLKIFENKVKALKSFIESTVESYGIRGVKVVVTFPAEAYVAESFSLEPVASIVKGPNLFISGSELYRVSEMLKNGSVKLILLSKLSQKMKAVEYAYQLSRDTGVKIAYVRTISIHGLNDYFGLVTYNLGSIVSALSSSSSNTSSINEVYYLVTIVLLTLISVVELIIIFRLKVMI